MKKGFTMIELIFVIVILGILAAVAIPRLTATRDDAEVSKAATNLTTIVSDISAYYTSQAKFDSKLSAMTNVQLSDVKGDATKPTGGTGDIMAAGKKCLSVKVVPYDAGTAKPATLTVTAGGTGESICDKIHAMPSIKKILDGKYTYQAIKTAATSTKEATYESKDSEKGEIAISGLGVVY